jgi:hypothetical protein
MQNTDVLLNKQKALKNKYKTLVEQAYNLRQTDSALSDISEYKAIKLLNKLNRLKFLSREQHQSIV